MSFDDTADSAIKSINRVFGRDAIYTYASDNSTTTIKGVFDNAYIEVQGMATKKPILKNVRLADLDAEPVEGDTVSINSVEYMVMNHEPDSFGSTTLILEKI